MGLCNSQGQREGERCEPEPRIRKMDQIQNQQPWFYPGGDVSEALEPQEQLNQWMETELKEIKT